MEKNNEVKKQMELENYISKVCDDVDWNLDRNEHYRFEKYSCDVEKQESICKYLSKYIQCLLGQNYLLSFSPFGQQIKNPLIYWVRRGQTQRLK